MGKEDREWQDDAYEGLSPGFRDELERDDWEMEKKTMDPDSEEAQRTWEEEKAEREAEDILEQQREDMRELGLMD